MKNNLQNPNFYTRFLHGKKSPESIEHLKIGRLKVKLRTDRVQTFVFRIGKWQITKTIIQ